MQDDVERRPRDERLVEAFAPSTVNDFINGKVGSRRVLADEAGLWQSKLHPATFNLVRVWLLINSYLRCSYITTKCYN